MMKKEQKYAVLRIDTECGGDAYLDTITNEEVLEEISGYNSYQSNSQGVVLYNDDEESFSSTVILSEKGLQNIRDTLKDAKSFDIKSIKLKDYLNDCNDGDDDF